MVPDSIWGSKISLNFIITQLDGHAPNPGAEVCLEHVKGDDVDGTGNQLQPERLFPDGCRLLSVCVGASPCRQMLICAAPTSASLQAQVADVRRRSERCKRVPQTGVASAAKMKSPGALNVNVFI